MSKILITRNQSDMYGRNLVEIDPTSLPQLSKQLRDLNNSQKPKNNEHQHLKTSSRVFRFNLVLMRILVFLLASLTLTCKYSLTFLLVNFFTKMNIARTPGGFQVPGVAEMHPTGLPQLFRHLSNLNNSQKCEKMQFTFFKQIQKN